MTGIIRQEPTFVRRTYRGGKMLMDFLGLDNLIDSFTPEDWISSFTEAKNRDFIANEGISRVASPRHELITEVTDSTAFGRGRGTPGVLIKLLDAGERLGIQVHPTRQYAKRIFGVANGKTESWHIIATREGACVYIGFKESVTKELWRELFNKQDIGGMLSAMHCFNVKKGDTILVRGGTPHAIGAGCFLMEVQEPTDYTMRVEKVTVAGERLTPMQIHYGAGEEALIDCFEYKPLTRGEAYREYFIKPEQTKENEISLVKYSDTELFAYKKIMGGECVLSEDVCLTVVSMSDKGFIETENGQKLFLKRGDRFFIPANVNVKTSGAELIVCYPPM